MDKPRYSLSRKLSVGLMFLAMPVFIISIGLFYFSSRDILHEELSKRTDNYLNTAMQRIVNYMNAVENAATSNAWLLEENFTPDSIASITQRIVERNRSTISCCVGTEPGMFPGIGPRFSVYTVNEDDSVYTVREREYEYFDKVWYKTARQTNKPCWIDPFSDYAEASLNYDEVIASFCLPLHTPDGRICGVLSTDFSFNSLAKALKSFRPPYPSAYFMLLGSDGRYLVHPDHSRLFRKTIFSDAENTENTPLIALGHEMTALKSGHMHISLNGHKNHVAYAPIPGTDCSLALVIHSSDMLGSHDHLTIVVVVIIFIGLLIIQWLCFRVVHNTIAPLNLLLRYTEQIAKSSYDEVIPQSRRKDVVAQLLNSFSAMQMSIITHIGSKQQANREIGQKNIIQEEKLQEAEEAVNRKNQFIDRVLHQIYAPLDAISEYAHVMLNNTLPKAQFAAVAKKINENTTILMRTVLMLYDSSDTRSNDATMYPCEDNVSANQTARDSINYIGKHFPDIKIGFETEIPDELRLQTNYLYLMRTIHELLYNASKYSDRQHIVVHVATTPANMVRFTVQDVGPGIPEQQIENIFIPFMKVDNLSEGLGLGLPLCKRHIERIGGSFTLDADYHEGCRFFIDVPL